MSPPKEPVDTTAAPGTFRSASVIRLILLHQGRIKAMGTARDVLTPEALESVFEWRVAVNFWDGSPQIVPLKSNESMNP